jgi:hypothetical protein
MIKALRQYCRLFLFIGLFGFVGAGMAQSERSSDLALAKRIESSPILPSRKRWFPLHSPFPGWEVGSVSGVAAGSDGNVYIIQRGAKADPILVFDKEGNLLRSWGKGDFIIPHSLRLDPHGNVWAVDAGASVIIKYSPDGKKLLTIHIGEVPDTGSPFRGVTDLTFAPNGHLFITDGYGNARILEFTAEGRRVWKWGRSGSGPAEFHLPHAIQINASGTVYVADRENGRIEEFDTHGKFLGEIDHLGRCYALKLANGILWASMSPMGEAPGAPGWLVQLDPRSGRILGHLDLTEARVGHAIDVFRSGAAVVTADHGLLLFTPQ